MVTHIKMTKAGDGEKYTRFIYSADDVELGNIILDRGAGTVFPYQGPLNFKRKTIFRKAAARLKHAWRQGDIPGVIAWTSTSWLERLLAALRDSRNG